jgi:hypothetical protein
MKKLLLGLALLATPSVALAHNGEVGVSLGNVEVGNDDVDVLELNGGFSRTAENGMTMQFDAANARLDFGGDADIGAGYGAFNLGSRNSGHAIYGFVGLGELGVSSTNIGVGGQLYLDRVTINGSFGYADFDVFELSNLGLDATYFINDNFGLTGELGRSEIDDDVDWTTMGVGGVFRFTDSPFTVSGGFQNRDFDGGEVETWRIGLTYNFGASSERDRSRTGSSFNGARKLFEESLVLPAL